MKITLVLAALATVAMAAPAEDTSGPVGDAEVSPVNTESEVFLAIPNEDGELDANAFCGGFSTSGCRAYCGNNRFACWTCTSSWCICDNLSCS